MNIIQTRQQQRRQKIGIIKASIESSVSPDYKRLTLICCQNWGMSERVVKEYIKIAKFEIEEEDTILNG